MIFLDEIRKGSLVIFKNAFGEPITDNEEIMKVFVDIFGNFGIVVSDVYKHDPEGLVVDIWFSNDIRFFAIPISRLQIIKPN